MTRKPIIIPEDEATDARRMTGAASTRYCPKCKAQTDHAIVIQIAPGHVTRAWQCLTCWRIHD